MYVGKKEIWYHMRHWGGGGGGGGENPGGKYCLCKFIL